jgi:hypothetical protein
LRIIHTQKKSSRPRALIHCVRFHDRVNPAGSWQQPRKGDAVGEHLSYPSATAHSDAYPSN